MKKLDIEELSSKYDILSENEEIDRNLYLRKLLTGEIIGPLTNYPNIDKDWLLNYTEEQIKNKMPKTTMYNYVKNANNENLDDIAIIYFDKKISFRKFFNMVDLCAASFYKNGVKEGDIVTLCMPYTPEVIVSVYALNKIGATASMVHPLSSENQIKKYINEDKSRLVISIDASYNKVNNIMNDTCVDKVVMVSPSDSMPLYMKPIYPLTKDAAKIDDKKNLITWNQFMKDGKGIEMDSVPYEEGRPAVIMRTGGTTGPSKGAVLTSDNFNSMVEQFKANASNFEKGDTMLTVMPPFHGFGLCSSCHLPLSLGVKIVIIPKININKIDKLMMKYKINHIVAVPTLFKGLKMVVRKKQATGKLKTFNLKGLKYAVSGGSLAKNGFEDDTDLFFEENGADIKLSKGYGLTEAVAGVTFADEDMKDENNVGIPMVATNIKIVDQETDEILPNNMVGEICVKGPTIMKEYYNNIEETVATIRDGWLHTGDIGYMNNGCLYFSERKGNMIISSGVNVYPSEIEQVIERCNKVAACAVIGIDHPYKEEVPKAFIELKPGIEATDEIDNEIQQLCIKNLDRYSQPFAYEYRDKLPQTLLGKISHNELKKEEERRKGYKIYEKRGHKK